MQVWEMRKHEAKARGFALERLGTLAGSLLLTAAVCGIFVLWILKLGQSVSDIRWLLLAVMLAFTTFLVWLVRWWTKKTNALREFFLQDDSGALYFLNAAKLAPPHPPASSGIWFFMQDIKDTAFGLERVDELLYSTQLLQFAMPITKIKGIRQKARGWRITCQVPFLKKGKSTMWLYIPADVAGAERLVQMLERLQETGSYDCEKHHPSE